MAHIRQSRPENVAHIRQSRPGSGRGFQVKVFKPFQVLPSSLGSRFHQAMATPADAPEHAAQGYLAHKETPRTAIGARSKSLLSFHVFPFQGTLPQGQGQNLALIVLYVPYSLDSVSHVCVSSSYRPSTTEPLTGSCTPIQDLTSSSFSSRSLSITHPLSHTPSCSPS